MISFIEKTFVFTLLFLVTSMNGQEARFYASADASKIFVNSTVNVTYTIENINDAEFTPPAFDWFEVVSGPSRSSSTTIVNGKRTMSNSFRYMLLSKKAGKFTLKPGLISVKGKKYETKPLSIEVIERDTKSVAAAAKDKDYILQLEISDSIAYIGQQINLNYVLYNKVQISSSKLLNEPDYDGFFKFKISDLSREVRREILNGQEYYRRVLKSVALYPQRTGDFTFGPVTTQFGIPTNNGNRRRFFFSQNLKYVNDVFPSVSLTVKSTPTPTPKSFSGGVGDFVMQASVDKSKVSTDDAVLVVLEMKGDGDQRTVQAPQQNFGKDWEVYDPKLITENTQIENRKRVFYKKYEYLIVPKRVGRLQVKPEFSFFDPNEKVYKIVKNKSFSIEVTQGTRSVTSDNREVLSNLELTPVLPLTSLGNYGETLFGSALHYSLLLSGVLGFIGIGFLKRKKDEEDNLDPALKRQNQARELALQILSKAKGHMDSAEHKLFFEEISKALYGFLDNKYQMNVGSLAMNDLIEMLQNKDTFPSEKVETVKTILSRCQQALYAASTNKDVSQVFKQTKDLIESLV